MAMSLRFWTVNSTIKGLTRALCRIDDRDLARVPACGPLILVCNHVNFLDAPIVYTHLLPRPLTGFAKSETWDSHLLGSLFNLWGAISLRRGEADIDAIRMGLRALGQGKIVAITPEGTRSGHGRLARGHPGVVTLALHSSAPMLPLVGYGQEVLRNNMRRLKRTDIHIRVGQLFVVNREAISETKITHSIRQAIADEIMYQLAALLPPQYRGDYADLASASTHYLQVSYPPHEE
jgi:1-acyl-sn-glycerol-3-phosphate acyltransferase